MKWNLDEFIENIGTLLIARFMCTCKYTLVTFSPICMCMWHRYFFAENCSVMAYTKTKHFGAHSPNVLWNMTQQWIEGVQNLSPPLKFQNWTCTLIFQFGALIRRVYLLYFTKFFIENGMEEKTMNDICCDHRNLFF